MRAWAVVENGAKLREIELPTPEPLGTQVLLAVTHCGVCHTDLHLQDGYYELGEGKRLSMADRGVKLPLVMGHEIVGRVVSAGPDAAGVSPGQLRVVYPWIGCGTCEACREERDNYCANMRSLGIFQNGGYATHVLVPHPRYLVDPGELDAAVAATYACSGITVYAAIQRVMPLPPDVPVLLVGAGGLGLSAIAMLRALGHRAIVAVDISAAKRAAARAAGASVVVDGTGESGDVTRRIVEACGGQVRAAIDLVGGTASARAAYDALAKGGRLIQVGLFGGELRVPLPPMAMRMLGVQGSFVGTPADLRAVVDLARSGALQPLPVQTLPLAEADAAVTRLRRGDVTGRLVLRAE
jgi:alcohol dehydrogenase/propanol-preferring alcohol dehydrogenase